MVDAVTVPVPDLDQGLAFYRDRLGHELIWRNDEIGQAGLRLPDSDTEIVLSLDLPYAPNWLVTSVPQAVADIMAAGGALVRGAPPDRRGSAGGGRRSVRQLTCPARSVQGRYAVDDTGRVTGVEAVAAEDDGGDSARAVVAG